MRRPAWPTARSWSSSREFELDRQLRARGTVTGGAEAAVGRNAAGGARCRLGRRGRLRAGRRGLGGGLPRRFLAPQVRLSRLACSSSSRSRSASSASCRGEFLLACREWLPLVFGCRRDLQRRRAVVAAAAGTAAAAVGLGPATAGGQAQARASAASATAGRGRETEVFENMGVSSGIIDARAVRLQRSTALNQVSAGAGARVPPRRA